ncbi:serine hydrolase [Maribacter sp. Asnod2-G09]|uniref:serine hydrolase n=1 Tax=Maribacter sp. Asnod2-G09 TaxID=3160577 RepID=UPI0038637F73
MLEVCYQRGIFNGNALVISDGEIIYRVTKGFSDGSKTKLLSEKSIFDIGSISKEFNAVAIMMLKEKGLIHLDDKISKFELGYSDWSNKVTIKNLLQYSSGLPVIDWENIHGDDDINANLKSLSTLAFEPGSGYLYSNNNIFIQRRIVEKITGKTFNEFLQQDILDPLGMDSSVIDHQYHNSDFARGFNSDSVNDDDLELKMSGWVCPTIEDLASWTSQLMSYKIISKESLHSLFKAYSDESQSALGTGKFLDNDLINYEHHGSSLSYESIVHFNLQDRTSIFLMTNSKSLKIGEISDAIIHILKDEDFQIPQKSVYLTIREKTYNDVEEGIAFYRKLKDSSFDTYNFLDKWELARLSYKLFEKDQNDEAIKILELLISELPSESEEVLGFLGSRILNENQLEKAILVYKLMVSEYPTGKSYSGLGDAYFKNMQIEQALNNYRKALELEPDNKKSNEMILKFEKM